MSISHHLPSMVSRPRPRLLLLFVSLVIYPTLSIAQESEFSTGEYQQQGVEHFVAGRFAESVEAFDKVIELNPRMAPRHWQRGISLYYAGEYQKGVEQFELHQTYNTQDVENAVWHFICKTRADGLKAAREALIPIHHDSRIPMKQVWQLFAGEIDPKGVLEATNQDSPYSRQQLNYAHLYLGLYYEALGEEDLAKKHIDLAANEYSVNNYMGMVAKVHAKVLAEK